ncbi:AarF/UbiB family protein [Enterococcus asini]|uniref:AarF/UbiB family protein n=1 Tax=Enterococcus asini TaxID=57732 RepID=A0AAW8U0D5_9ENTE|nr:AarF/UbiB family protein [Enterococcus asini]MDT2810234.1 AarF/UbiB family protein [Enterococcus asini]
MPTSQGKSSTQRLKEILQTFRQYKVIQNFSRQENPQAVREAFERLGPTFIKIGQVLSVRTDLLTPAYLQAFKSLQDSVKSDPFPKVKALLEAEWQQPLTEIFDYFAEEAFASASIGQAHHARLKNGQEVVVKVQHPGIVADINVDLALFEKAIPLISYVPESNVIDLKSALADVRRSLDDETDFLKEAHYGERFYELNNNWHQVKVPKIYPEYCTKRVILLEMMTGKSLRYLLEADPKAYAEPGLTNGEFKKDVALLLVKSFMKQVFEDGFFHADPHPGNLLTRFLPTGSPGFASKKKVGVFAGVDYQLKWQDEQPDYAYQLIYLDFGMMGELPDHLRSRLIDALLALYTQDSQQMGEAVLHLCRLEGPFDETAFYGELGGFLERYANLPLKELDIQAVLGEVVQICHRNNLQLIPQVTMLMKALSTLEGVIEELDPELSLMEVIQPYAEKYYLKQLDVADSVKRLGLDFAKSSKSLPRLPARSLQALETFIRGKSQVTMSFKEQKQFLNLLEILSNRLTWALIVCGLFIASALLLDIPDNPTTQRLGFSGITLGLVVTGLLALQQLLSWWRRRK